MDFTGLNSAMQTAQRRAAQATPGSFLAKVVSQSAGYYVLETPDGRTIRHVNSGTKNTWQADNYVTVDVTAEGFMQIRAAGAAQSE